MIESLTILLPSVLGIALFGIHRAWGLRRGLWGIVPLAAVFLALPFVLGPRWVNVPRAALLESVILAGFAVFLALIRNLEQSRLGESRVRVQEMETRLQEEEKQEGTLKGESGKVEKEMLRIVRVYGAVKGMGEALSWDEMVPHMDYAVQECLGFKDYQLYLLEENGRLQKILSRGRRIPDAAEEPPLSSPRWQEVSGDTLLWAPIRKGSSVIAALRMRLSPAQAKVSRELILAETLEISEELQMGLEKARLFSSLEKLSRIDGLTGVFRRQIFDERLYEEIRRARAFRTPFSILIGDIDHFKKINDTYGHPAGDEVLKRIGEILKESVYETDFVARYGGEEFVILLPQADPVGVLRKAEAIRRRVESETFVLGWNRIQTTISFGIAHFPQHGQDSGSLLESADRCLYLAKSSGRNRVVDASQVSAS